MYRCYSDMSTPGRRGVACAGISANPVQGRVALGARAAARVLQLWREPDAPWVTSRGPPPGALEGFVALTSEVLAP